MLIVEISFVHQLLRMDWLNNLKQICELIHSKQIMEPCKHSSVVTGSWEVVENEFWCCRPCNIAGPVYITLGMPLKIFLVHFESTLKQFRV
jgi:hypothetical protein